MTFEETQKLIKRIRKADADDDDEMVEPLVKELIFGAVINIARIADKLSGA